MTKLSKKQRDDAHRLLEEHQAVTDAISNMGKSRFLAGMDIRNDQNNDFSDVRLERTIALKALREQKTWIETELTKLDIEILK